MQQINQQFRPKAFEHYTQIEQKKTEPGRFDIYFYALFDC